LFHIKASDFGTLHTPELCELRLYLQKSAAVKAVPGDFEALLIKLGNKHEAATLELLRQRCEILDLSSHQIDEAAWLTLDAVATQHPCIYQGAFKAEDEIRGLPVTVSGRPDFLVFEDGGYTVLDAKLPQSLDKTRHLHIHEQLHLYGWLFEKCCGRPATRLHVRLGNAQVVELGPASDEQVRASLGQLLGVLASDSAPFSPVGWSKCSHCAFNENCWQPAVDRRDVSVVSGVDKGLARYFYDTGLSSWDKVNGSYDYDSLSNVVRPWGTRTQRAGKVLRNADALTTGMHSIFDTVVLRPVQTG